MKQAIKSNNSISKIIIRYYLILLPLIIYGFYKNGIFLYNKGLIDIILMFKPLIICLFSVGLGYLIEYIDLKTNKKDFSNLKASYLPLSILLVTMMLPNLSYLLLIIIIVFTGIILKFLMKLKININKESLIKVIIIVILLFFNLNSYKNVYELNEILHYDFLDHLMGFNSGGICSSSIFLMIVGFIFLTLEKTYKKEIPLYIFISYFILKTVYATLIGDINILKEALLNTNLFYGMIFIASINYSSPLKAKVQILYGIGIGILTFAFDFITLNESIFMGILIMSLVANFEQKLLKTNKKKHFL